MIYLDNAATTFPKAPGTLERAVERYRELGVSPGRGNHDLAMRASDAVDEVRAKVAAFFGAPDPARVVFGANATDALNTVLLGLIRPGDHVVTTRLDHNSVLRPLHHLAESGAIIWDAAGFDERGQVSPDEVEALLRPNTRLVVMTHASNVIGTVQPVAEIARRCAARGVPVVLDVAQSAGQVPIHMAAMGVSALAFTGHKSLYGPSGIGGLVVMPGLEVATTRFGGTGMDSASLAHTPTYPLRLEAGTLNLLGVLGLGLGLDFVVGEGVEAIHAREAALLTRLRDGLVSIDGVTVDRADGDLTDRVAVLACNVAGVHPQDVGAILDGDFDIAVRVGVHCAPLVHRDLGTIDRGAVRFSLGAFTTEADVDAAIAAMRAIAGI
ncbi:MAG: aminotransferase class V-fold PLP-dependent enzyme [Candidatus Limnocylindrales bacterium]